MIFAATANDETEEAAMMFLVELLSGGIFTVYAVDSYANLFLIYKDDAWQWIEMNCCKLYCAGAPAKKEEKDGNNSCD